jgi:hypothetical protein
VLRSLIVLAVGGESVSQLFDVEIKNARQHAFSGSDQVIDRCHGDPGCVGDVGHTYFVEVSISEKFDCGLGDGAATPLRS